MPTPTTTVSPVQTPTIAPTPADEPWRRTYSDPAKICPQQKRELTSPDVMP